MLQPSLDLNSLAWPASRLGEAVELLAHKARLATHPASSLASPADIEQAGDAALEQWVEMIAARLGIEAEPVETSFGEMTELVRGAAPAILRLPDPADAPAAPKRFLALLSGGRRVVVLRPDLRVRRVQSQALGEALCHPLIGPWLEPADTMLAAAGIAESRRGRARLALVREHFSAQTVGGGWLLRLSPGTDPWRQVRHARLWRPLAALTGAELVQQGLLVLTWWFIGRSVFGGWFEQAWLPAWALVVFTAIPFQLLMSWAQGWFAMAAGAIIKQRLLFGALNLQPDEIRHMGMGQFLGRVMESEAVEQLALGGGLAAVIALLQLGTAGWVLAMGAGGWTHVGLLGLWVAMIVLFGWRYYRHSLAWAKGYRGMTNDLVERMVGHRTRLAQEDPRLRHVDEDRDLARYLGMSERLDGAATTLAALPGLWLAAGLAVLGPAFVNAPAAADTLAIGLGGVMLAHQALGIVMGGMENLVQMGMAWQQVKPLFGAASRRAAPPATLALSRPKPGQNGDREARPVLQARGLSFRYRQNGRPALSNCGLEVLPGDRLLLEGPSGGGKTTLAAVLSGLRVPEAGVLLLHGYDRQSLGDSAWRRRVAVSPQFHENHIFSDTFAFNLLMARRWPPTPEDLRDAEAICDELGLGDLLARMPSGMQQMVGENGWQLSHGERSRVFIARALLQNADLIILDESFGALDPENLHRALRCALNRAATLLVIAHP